MHWLTYCLDEAVHSLWRQKGSTLLSMLTIAAAVLVLGGFLVVTVNLDRVLSRWGAAAEFSIYLRDDITQDQRVALNRMLAESPIVASREFVSKADAMTRFKRDFPDLVAGLDGAPVNPLPSSIELRLRPQAAQPEAVEALAARLERADGVADLRFDRRWLTRLGNIVAGLRVAGWALGIVLLIAAVLTVSTVVRLALHSRRDEIEIMQLMGAPMALLRGPLVTEGILQGGAGAVLALAILYATFAAARHQVGPMLAGILDPALLGFLTPGMSALLVSGGMAVGCVGGCLAARHVR